MHVTVVNTQTVSSCTALSMRVSRVIYFEIVHMLEVRNIDMMSLINLFPVGWLPMHYFMSTKLYSV